MSDVLAGPISRYASFEFQYLMIPLPVCLRLAAFMSSIDRVSFCPSHISPDTSANLSGLDNLSSPALSVSESFATSCRRYYPRLSWLRKSSSELDISSLSNFDTFLTPLYVTVLIDTQSIYVYLKFINLEFIMMR